ncbi:MAG: hypothetical protein PUG78_05000 [Eubacteriales bacterium]|nr:hypothetical protein [Eubacteriales bacterium]
MSKIYYMKEWELNDKTYCCLISEIKKIRSFDDEEKYIEKYVYPHRSRTFSQYLREYMHQNNIAVADVMKNSGINRNYGYNIINGTRKKPGRDKVIALCIGAGMDIDHIQYSLAVAGFCALNPRDERDVRIAAAALRGTKDILRLNIYLEEHGIEPLMV